MPMKIRIEWVALALLFTAAGAPGVARGSGFEITVNGTAALGMAGAFAAKADDASAIFFNPAGIAKLRGLQAYVGGVLISAKASASGTAAFPLGDQPGELELIALPSVYVSYGLPHDVAIGIGAFTHFGLKVDWTDSWPGRFIIQSVSLDSITINPTIAWRPAHWLSIGAGIDITPASADLTRSVNLVTTEGSLRFRGNDVGVGGNVGVLFEGPKLHELPFFSVGATYRSRYNLEFDDGAIQVKAPPELSAVLHDSKATARLTIPDTVTVGGGIRPIDALFLQVQFDWTRWRRFQSLALVATNNPALNLTIPENWSDGYAVRSGMELAVSRVRLRAGFGYEWNPIPAATLSPIIPDGDRFIVSAGAGVHLPANLVLEGAVMGLIFRSRDSALPGFPVHYSTWAVVSGLSLSYRAGR